MKPQPFEMITFTTAATQHDLEGVLQLQKRNLAGSLTESDAAKEGFVTVDHSYAQLKKMNDIAPHIIAKDNDRVIGYLLAMTSRSRNDIPVLVPMFREFESILYRGKPVGEWNYLVVGQVCIDKAYRGQGVLDRCYAAYRDLYRKKYDFAITEIATVNHRSRRAHQKTGFEEIHFYSSPGQTGWVVVLWDWNRER